MNKFSKIFFISIILYSYLAGAIEHTMPNIESFIDKFKAQMPELQGGAIAILYQGQVIYKETFGFQKDNSKAITSSTLFPLGSVSKPVSVAAVALLVDGGALYFEQQFKLPYFKNKVSLTNILGHTTGYTFPGNFQIEEGVSRNKLLKKLSLQQPQCKPSKCYSYSNMTFSLVEEALNTEKLSLSKAMKNMRLALKTDGVQVVPINPNLEIAYPHKNGHSLQFPPYYPKAVPASAGAFASLDGMIEIFKLSFGYRPDLISQKTLNSIHKPIIANKDLYKWKKILPYDVEDLDSYYGIGWRILTNKKHPGENLICHGGYIAGINSFIGFIPSKEIGVIILLNQETFAAVKNGLSFWKTVIE